MLFASLLQVLLVIFVCVAEFGAQPAPIPIPWLGSFEGKTVETLQPDYYTYVFTDRANAQGEAVAGNISDYVSIEGGWAKLSFDAEAIFAPNAAQLPVPILRSDLVQFFAQPKNESLYFHASIRRDGREFHNLKSYQVFFLEADAEGSKNFELVIDYTMSPPKARFFVRSTTDAIWETVFHAQTQYNFVVQSDDASKKIVLYASEGPDQPCAVAEATSDVITEFPELHIGLLIYEKEGATLEGSESLSFSGVSVETSLKKTTYL